jgi:hypothetical protein
MRLIRWEVCWVPRKYLPNSDCLTRDGWKPISCESDGVGYRRRRWFWQGRLNEVAIVSLLLGETA